MAFMMSAKWAAAALLVGGLTASAVSAQERVRVRGQIAKVEGQVLTVKSREGDMLTIKVPENVVVSATMKRSMADIKANDFVGIAAMPQGSGPSRALEVLIFPEAMRGTGEGHYGWDLMPESTMTNAAVAETVASVNGQTLTLKYKDGQQTFAVAPDTPIVTFAPADKAALKPGAPVFIGAATKAPDGSLNAARVTVAGDIAPPM